MKTSPFQPGDRIELVEMLNDPYPVPTGTQGTVEFCNYAPLMLKQGMSEWQIGVKWDSGRTLSLCVPPDKARKI